ncbi:MAG: DUF2892 domain-containing protein [Pseudomonadota bacterium]
MRFANVGTADRIARLLIGLGLIALPFIVASMALPAITGIASLAVGAILTITAVVKFCPIYGVLGLRTSPKTD